MNAGKHEILHGDCLTVLADLEKDSVDLILADPPYGITNADFDQALDLASLWPALWRVAKPKCAIVLTASQPFTSLLVTSQIKQFKHEWIWVKNRGSGFLNAKIAPFKEHESILVFAKNGYAYNPEMQDRTGNAKIGSIVTGRRTKTKNYGNFHLDKDAPLAELRFPSSVQKFNVCLEALHPQQKPVDLFRYLIRTYSNPGDTVLDFSAGSGTTSVAAIKEGRNSIAIEREHKFIHTIRRRMGHEEALLEVQEYLLDKQG